MFIQKLTEITVQLLFYRGFTSARDKLVFGLGRKLGIRTLTEITAVRPPLCVISRGADLSFFQHIFFSLNVGIERAR